MSTSDTIALVGILATFTVSIINLIMTRRSATRSDYNSVISKTRNDWIRDLRIETGEFISISFSLFYNPERKSEQFGKLVGHGFVIKTCLGKRFEKYAQCVDDIISMLECDTNTTELVFYEKIRQLEKYSSECYIDQWTRNNEEIGKRPKKH